MSREIEIKSIPVQLCLPFKDLLPSMPCFTIGCPYGLHGVDKQRSTPLVLDGVISGVDPEAKRIYTSTPTFPGNSGGPLIAVRGSVSNDGRQMIIGRSPVLLAGIMLETRLVFSPDPAVQTPPLHLGFAVPMDAVISLLDAKEVQAIVTRFAPKA
jgi:S1-C subfamily serine protease